MKKKWMAVMTAILAMSSTVPALAQHIYAGDDVEKVVSYDENGRKVITLIFDPAKMPDEVREQLGLGSPAENKENKAQSENISTAMKLTEPPKEGEALANIQYADETGRLRYTSPYYTYGYGQCTWYAGGRFEEVHGIHISIHGYAKEWLDSNRWDASLEVVTDLSSVPEQSIAIYVPKTDNRLAGHVCFIEYVERDEKGNPLYIYYTDANGKKDTVKNAYTPGVDGMVIKEDYQTFLENDQLKLAGYLKVKE